MKYIINYSIGGSDTIREENEELDMIEKYLNPDAVVLEIGGRQGIVSEGISKKLNNPKNHLVIEPDKTCKDYLYKISSKYGCNVFMGALSKKEIFFDGHYTSNSFGPREFNEGRKEKVNVKTLDELQNEYNLIFDTLIVDCEGCIINIFDEFPELFNQIKTIFIEYDMPKNISDSLVEKFKKNNYKSIYKGPSNEWMNKRGMGTSDNIIHEIWTK